MVLTPEHLRQYREGGYCLIEELIPGDLIEPARQRTMEIAAALPDWPAKHFQVLDPGRYTSEGGQPGGIVEESTMTSRHRGVAGCPEIIAPEPRLRRTSEPDGRAWRLSG